MEHELYDKTDKQLLKTSKLELVDYIRTLEGTLTTAGDTVEDNAGDNTTDTMTGLVPDGVRHKPLTSYSFDGSIEVPKDLYSF